MRSGWPSSGRLDALISSTRRLNTRHEWFIRILVVLVALNVILELRPLWSTSAPGRRCVWLHIAQLQTHTCIRWRLHNLATAHTWMAARGAQFIGVA